MSRLIVKNLPKTITEQKIRDVFTQKGTITDVQLKYKDGKFRQFCFVGYENEESAQKAVEFYNNTFIGTSRVTVEICAVLGQKPKEQPWSKNVKDKEKKVDLEEPTEITPEINKTPNKSKIAAKVEAILGDHKEDALFQEFMKSHAKDKLLWDNDIGISSKNENENEENKVVEIETEKLANAEISDTDYMKQLMGKSNSSPEKDSNKTKENWTKLYTVKVRNVPKSIKREELIKFFRPAKAYSVRIPKQKGFAYIGFKLERDLQKALGKDKSFLKGKQIQVYHFTDKSDSDGSTKKTNPRWQEQEELLMKEEDICESGKLFFRNLAYNVTEDDIQKLFEKYGAVVEVNVPIDPVSRKIKGFGTVTFMMPEHAVVAYTELNGTMFHGRMFHVLPAKSNEKKDEESDDEQGFKKKKQAALRNAAGSAHNWNTLFLGQNAIADVMAKSFGKSKEEVLNSSKGGSDAAVRLALGETQIVLEMKSFLESHGVRLESFEDGKSKRSKTILLAKNLPAKTNVEELTEKFSPFGIIQKIVLPPSGVTALIKFDDPSEARKAFKKLVYTKFKHLPLYLEWAPENSFKDDAEIDNEKKEKEVKQEEESNVEKGEEEDEEILSPEPNTTLFLRNLNFITTEETVREAFKKLGKIFLIQIAKKRNVIDPKHPIHLGYGFIQFLHSSSAEKALRTMQFCVIDGNKVELQRSERTLRGQEDTERRQPMQKKKNEKISTKIMVKNIPFQANANEIKELFKTFGEIKALRLPKKMGSDQHRGFGFVDFLNKSEAKCAFDALKHSTHLYGRRLVLEWAETDQDVDEIRKRTANEIESVAGSKAKKFKKTLEKDFIKFSPDEEESD
ncbi:CLUMA_CG015002, isoform A [Clunio marinus]|uniref:CLUMA_CG015002, isoform A n=1 Tax=Clunio marinus TaxID=568069 RepID=A0A1J1IPY6_9DIPT|nr:CLUMA_CG015002, isoform A [Clunio marinus]